MKRIFKHLLWIIPLLIVLGVVSLAAITAAARSADGRYHANLPKTIQVSSDNFQHEQEMPAELSCRGRGMAPHIRWAGAPAGARSYALIAMDWDAPSPILRLFPVAHWVLYNIPAGITEIPKNSNSAMLKLRNIASGLNISRQPGYVAPCPPIGAHRYEFRVYALDVDQIQPESNDKAGVMKAIEGKILAYGELVGIRKP